MKHQFTPEAAKDYEGVALYYRTISKQVADFFVEEIQTGIALIEKFPEAWPQVDRKTRCFLGNKFPYEIYYRIVENTIQIGGIMALKRKPGLWKRRFQR